MSDTIITALASAGGTLLVSIILLLQMHLLKDSKLIYKFSKKKKFKQRI